MRNKICLVIVWFGEFPSWMPFFLASCGGSRGIDWQIFTENPAIPDAPANVQFRCLTKTEFAEIAGRRLGVQYSFSHGYKLCDMKPAYGDFFSEFLQDYDYWGYSDVDVIVGDLLPKLQAADAMDADIITAGSRLLVGHFTLLRNTPKCVFLYRECANWRAKFQAYEYQKFDEAEFSEYAWSLHANEILSITEVPVWQEDCLIEWSGRPCFFILWKQGQLFDVLALRSTGYFHFIRTKYRKNLVPAGTVPRQCFVLTDGGFLRLETISDMLQAAAKLVFGFIRTGPWYLKQLLKRLLPRSVRIGLRTLLFGVASPK